MALKLLQINETANWGSTGRIAEGIGNVAAAAGINSWIAYGRQVRTSRSNLIRIGNLWELVMHGIASRIFDRHGLASRRATAAFIQQLRELRPDVIHLHNIHGYFLNYPLLFDFLKEIDVPVVWTLHDCWPFTGHCSHFTSCSCDRWKTKCHHCPQKNSYPKSFVLDRSWKNYEEKKHCFTSLKKLCIVSVSHWLDGLVGESFLRDQRHIVIPNGVDTTVFSPTSDREPIRKKLQISANDTMLLGVASIWGERKGLLDFIELSKRLLPNQKIVLVGLNEKQKKLLPKNIIGISRTDSTKQLAEYYSAADIVLNLSVEETFGLTTIEGFSCGTPGIVYNATASPELIREGTGLIVQPHNMGELQSAITQITALRKEKYAEKCRNVALTYFDQQLSYEKYVELYLEMR